jgi:uncharacterized protein (TIGR00251 family)
MAAWLEDRGSVVRLRVRAQPRASRTEAVGVLGDAIKIRIAAPPVDDAANDELVRYIAKAAGVSRSAVRLVAGATGRNKIVEIEGVTASRIVAALES